MQRTRRFKVAHVAAGVLALVLCFVPLFNLLGYEFSLVIAGFATIACAPVTFQGLRSEPMAGAPQRGPAATCSELVTRNLPLLLGPLVVILANSLRVRLCDLEGGLAIYALLPGVTVVYATVAAYVSALVAGPRRWLAGSIYAGLVVASVAGALAYLALEPPIVTVNAYLGYFAGSIYDEALAVPAPLLAYRLLQLAFAAALVSALDIAWRVQHHIAFPMGLRALAFLSAATVTVGYAHHVELGFSITRADIQSELGGRYESEHFVLYYPATAHWEEQIAGIAEDHEFRYAQLVRFFGAPPFEGRIASFLYGSREEKGRLMGARRTLVAKLWLGEMHLRLDGFGDPILSHELAHVFSQPWGRGPLDLSAQWAVLPNMGLVEGLATAADFSGRELTPHGWAAALRTLDLAPDIVSILGAGGFYSRYSRTVYTVMGSFVRWLMDTRGVESFAAAYGTGNIEEVYGVSLDSLVGEWEAFLDGWPVGDDELAMAEYYFDRPSIFGKVCARNLGARRLRLEAELGAGRVSGALQIARDIVALDPLTPGHRQQLIGLLLRVQAYEEAEAQALELLGTQGIGVVTTNQVRETLADLRWLAGRKEEAVLGYGEVLEGTLPSEIRRRIQLKLAAVGSPSLEVPLQRYFLGTENDQRKLLELVDALTQHPESPQLQYLVGLRMQATRHFSGAVHHLRGALGGGLGSPDLEENARFVLAESYFFVEDHDAAAAIFRELAGSAGYEGQRARAADWMERLAWKDGRQLSRLGVDHLRGTATGAQPSAARPVHARAPGAEQPCGLADWQEF